MRQNCSAGSQLAHQEESGSPGVDAAATVVGSGQMRAMLGSGAAGLTLTQEGLKETGPVRQGLN